jgi:two-component system phosphate regulon response regulator PhoB
MTQPVKVLVVEDEDDIRELVALNLRKEGFEVLESGDGAGGLAKARRHLPPIVLLDLMLPDLSGVDICAQLRADETTRDAFIIMVTARTQEGDRIEGFLAGADDYVAKPFSVRELVLRVKAAARRVGRERGDDGEGALRIGTVRIDLAAHRAFVADEELQLTATEYRLLAWLAEHAGRLCTRGELLEKVWELPASLNTRTVDTHVKRLRQKLGSAASYVETVRGAGYRFRSADEA